MEPGKKEDDGNEELEFEPREYSSPACFLHEVEGWTNAAAQTVTIYHNPACSKSRQTLALIQASGITPRVVEYLKTPPGEVELGEIARKLGIAPAELVRTGEPLFKEKYSDKQLDDREWIKALARDPILMQRPIVVRGDAAVIGRPPENAKRLLF
jgi:arsenate reductase (glutaredoxin)